MLSIMAKVRATRGWSATRYLATYCRGVQKPGPAVRRFTPQTKTPETLRLLASSNGNPVAHRIMHRPSLPVDRVAGWPHSRSSRTTLVAVPSCPFPASGWLSRRPIPMVAHLPRPFGCAGDLHSSFPELLMPLALPVSAGFQVSLVAPAPPASPAIRYSGCPSFRTSGFTGDGSSSRPDSHIFRRCRL
jgi:hypothetical protein